jgi:hypothetical protein
MKNPQTDQDQSRGKSSGANGSAEEDRPPPSGIWGEETIGPSSWRDRPARCPCGDADA